MPRTDDFCQYIVDSLQRAGPARYRSMFGAFGIYLHERMVGLVSDGALYLRVDDVNRGDFEAAGMGPFMPWESKPLALPYFQVPSNVVDDEEELRTWAIRSRDAAARAKAAKKVPLKRVVKKAAVEKAVPAKTTKSSAKPTPAKRKATVKRRG